MKELTHHQKKDWVLGLLVGCPFGKPLENCPLTDFRKIPIEERIRLANSMDEKQIDQILVYHQQCLRERESMTTHLA